MRFLLALLTVLFLSLAGPSVSEAQTCNKRMTSPSTVSPSAPTYTAMATWLQWLNNGNYTCSNSGFLGALVCTHNGVTGEKYTLIMQAQSGGYQNAQIVDRNGAWRNNVSWVQAGDGTASTFYFDNGSRGYLTLVCALNLDTLGNPCPMHYDSCWRAN